MGAAKQLQIRALVAKEANAFMRRAHYSGKVVPNSQLHLGVYLNGRLEGALQFGPPMDKRKLIGLVEGTTWNGFLELNRMAFTEALPRNSESRAIAVCMRLLRKHRPEIRWVVSYADATMCGDGTIYRAAGFVLTGIKRDENMAIDAEGGTHHKISYQAHPIHTGFSAITGGKCDWDAFVKAKGWTHAEGFQLRYIYFLDPAARGDLAVPEIPYSEIQARGVGMYRGRRTSAGSIEADAAATPGGRGRFESDPGAPKNPGR